MTDHVRITLDAGIMVLTLNRPEKKNALTNAMYDALFGALERAETDSGIRAIVFEAEGDAFSAGNDLLEFAAVVAGGETRGGAFIGMLAKAQKPYVAAVHGLAVGLGVTMLLHCDLVFVAEDARLSTPFVNLALVPEAASTLLLPARIGHARAYAMFALGEPIDGRKAAEIGLANAALPSSEVRSAARAAAKALAAKPAGALRLTKQLMRNADTITARMELEGSHFRAQLKSKEAAEAFRAFAERRAPDFAKIA